MQGQPVLIGGMNLDVQAVPAALYSTQPGGTVPGQITLTSGGVARNIAQCLGALLKPNQSPLLISIIGLDNAGDMLLSHWQSLGLSCQGILRKAGVTTSLTSYIFNKAGDVAASIADVRTVEEHLQPADLHQFHTQIQQAGILLLDANLAAETIEAACALAQAAKVPVWFEPVSVPKAVRATKVLNCVTYISPNAHELIAMAMEVDPSHDKESASKLLLEMAAGSATTAAKQLEMLEPYLVSVLQEGVEYVVLTMGSQGAALCTLGDHRRVLLAVHLPALPVNIVNTNGAGDCLVAGCLASLLQRKHPDRLSALAYGMVIAKEGLESASNVPTLVADDSLVIAAEQLRQKFAAHFPGGYCPYPNGRYSRL